MRNLERRPIFWICATICLAHLDAVIADVFEECVNEPSSTFIASPKGCNFYIFCNGQDSYDGDCGEGFYFNNIFKSCDPQNEVECRIEPITNATALPEPTTASTPDAANTTFPLPSMSSTVVSSTAATTQASSTGTMTQTAVVSTTQAPSTNTASGTPSAAVTFPTPFLPTECPASDNPNQIVYLAHPNSCSDYFVCYHGQMVPMHCSPMLHFNVRTNKCDYPEKALCQASLSSPKEQCRSYTVDLFPYARNCNYFYYCKNGYLMLQQCPIGFGWDLIKRSCVSMNEANCYNQQNRL